MVELLLNHIKAGPSIQLARDTINNAMLAATDARKDSVVRLLLSSVHDDMSEVTAHKALAATTAWKHYTIIRTGAVQPSAGPSATNDLKSQTKSTMGNEVALAKPLSSSARPTSRLRM